MADQAKVYLFWDNSNTFVPVRYATAKHVEAAVQWDVRIHFETLYNLARGGRTVVQGFCVGYVPPDLERVWERIRTTGVDLELFERGEGSGREQAVDQALQVRMLRTALDITKPEVAVLLTGDGSGYEDGVGFRADLERLYDRGWGIEVISWDGACNQGLKSGRKTTESICPWSGSTKA